MYQVPIIYVPAKRVHVFPRHGSCDNDTVSEVQTNITSRVTPLPVLFPLPVIKRVRLRPYCMISGAIIAAKTSM